MWLKLSKIPEEWNNINFLGYRTIISSKITCGYLFYRGYLYTYDYNILYYDLKFQFFKSKLVFNINKFIYLICG